LNKLNEDHADILSGNRQYERRLTVWVYYIQNRKWFECMLMKYTKKGKSNMGIQIKWIEADTTSEYTSEEMELAIRFDEPTDEEKQMYSVLKRKVRMLGNRKKQKIMPKAVHEASFESNYSYMTNQEREEVWTSHLFTARTTVVNITISSQSLGVEVKVQDGKAILTKKKVASADQSGVCPEIKAANIPLGACLSFINGTKIVSTKQAAQILRSSPRPVTIRFEFAHPAPAPAKEQHLIAQKRSAPSFTDSDSGHGKKSKIDCDGSKELVNGTNQNKHGTPDVTTGLSEVAGSIFSGKLRQQQLQQQQSQQQLQQQQLQHHQKKPTCPSSSPSSSSSSSAVVTRTNSATMSETASNDRLVEQQQQQQQQLACSLSSFSSSSFSTTSKKRENPNEKTTASNKRRKTSILGCCFYD
jgi:hypothetical protein